MTARVTIFWLAVVALAAALRLGSGLGAPPLLEALVYLALLAWSARQAALLETLTALTAARRTFFVALVGLLVAGQLVDRGALTFPFVDWGMYSKVVRGDPSYLDYTAELADGREIRFDAFRALRSLASRYIRPLDYTAREIVETEDGPEREALVAAYDRAIAVMAEAWNRDHPDERVTAVRVWRYTVPLDGYDGPDSIERVPFRRVEIEP